MNTADKRRICMVVYNDLVHDARVFKEASTLHDAGYDMHVIGMKDETSEPLGGWEGIRTTRIEVGHRRSLRLRYAAFWRNAYRQVVADCPDAVHAHDLDALPPAWFATRKLRVPLVHDAHELWVELPSLVNRPHIRSIWEFLARTLIPRCDAVFTVSNGIAEEMQRRYGVSTDVLRNVPIDSGSVVHAPLRSELGIGDNQRIMLFQGGLLPGLGIERSIHAMEHLPNIHLVIIGGGPLRDEIQREVEQSNHRDRIHLLKPVPFDQLKPITVACDVGLHLGRSAGLNVRFGLPNKLFEYISAGIPSVITDWPEQGTLTRQYGTGATVPPDATPSDIAATVLDVLANHEQYTTACTSAAKQLVWSNESAPLIECYNNLSWRTR
jgi:glycosyltransferase involved in cell wall biosynthesis